MRVKGWRRVPREEELNQSKAPITRLAGDPDDCECAEEPELLTFPRTRPCRSPLAHDCQRIQPPHAPRCPFRARAQGRVLVQMSPLGALRTACDHGQDCTLSSIRKLFALTSLTKFPVTRFVGAKPNPPRSESDGRKRSDECHSDDRDTQLPPRKKCAQQFHLSPHEILELRVFHTCNVCTKRRR